MQVQYCRFKRVILKLCITLKLCYFTLVLLIYLKWANFSLDKVRYCQTRRIFYAGHD